MDLDFFVWYLLRQEQVEVIPPPDERGNHTKERNESEILRINGFINIPTCLFRSYSFSPNQIEPRQS